MNGRYNFTDISVLCRKNEADNIYINLTDYDFCLQNVEKRYTELTNSKSRYALTVFESYVSEITFEELLILAGQKSERFIRQIINGTEADGELIVAVMCAKKILNYRWGRCNSSKRQGDKILFEFTRNDGKGNHPVVLKKTFIKNSA